MRLAKKNKFDELYTRLSDIEQEISSHADYIKYFNGKVVFCNCDDPEYSSFYEFFRLHFNQLHLKKLITTHYNADGSPSYKLEWSGEMLGDDTVNMIKTPLKGNGDFRSEECVELLKESDIVVTNPPFSLLREFIAQLMEYEKDFVILGPDDAPTYKDLFPLFESRKILVGYGRAKTFDKPDGTSQTFGNIGWYTNLILDKIHEPLILNKIYNGNEEKYPKYDNFDAIHISDYKSIPKDYYGVMGVPVTFLGHYCPEQFEIVGNEYTLNISKGRGYINGKRKFARIFIKRKDS